MTAYQCHTKFNYFQRCSPFFMEIMFVYPGLAVLLFCISSLFGLSDAFWFLIKCAIVYRVFKCFLTMGRGIYLHYIVPKLNWCPDLKEYQHLYVAITGCTDGIGKAYAIELAKKGLKKFILIGRDDSKLTNVATILRKHGVKDIEKVIIDFINDDYSILDEPLTKYEIGILVNSAGIAPPNVAKITANRRNMASDIVKVNALSTVKTCELILPQMEERQQGIIVNVASVQAWRPVPMLSTYSGSKACVSFFTKCIGFDYNNCGIKAQCLVPILVATKMTHYDKDEADGFIVVNSEDYARQAVSIIGLHSMTSGCWQHEMQITLGSLVPGWLLFYILMPVYYFQEKRCKQVISKKE